MVGPYSRPLKASEERWNSSQQRVIICPQEPRLGDLNHATPESGGDKTKGTEAKATVSVLGEGGDISKDEQKEVENGLELQRNAMGLFFFFFSFIIYCIHPLKYSIVFFFSVKGLISLFIQLLCPSFLKKLKPD